MSDNFQQFHNAVYFVIQQIPYGEVATYRYVGEIAGIVSDIKVPYPEIEVAYVVNAHEGEASFHRVIYTYIKFRNEYQKELLLNERAIDIDLRQVRYWKSPLERKDLLERVNFPVTNGKLKFKGLQEYFYLSHENSPHAFKVKQYLDRKKPMLKDRCLCENCSSLNSVT